MFPINLDTTRLKIVLAGNGVATARRLILLDNAGVKHVVVFSENPSEELAKNAGKRLSKKQMTAADLIDADVVMIADYDEKISEYLAGLAREKNIFVNVEDKKKYCDFHVPAIVRRGDLLLTVSTNGASPRLARKLRQVLEKLFPNIWAERIKEIGECRKIWKEAGDGMEQVASKTDEILEKKGWLKELA